MGITVTSNKGEERFHGGCGICLSRVAVVLNDGGNVDLAESRGGAE